MKVVINKCYGGFGLSQEACELYAKKAGFVLHSFVEQRNPDGSLKGFREKNRWRNYDPKTDKDPFIIYHSKAPLQNGELSDKEADSFYDGDLKRDDPILVAVVEELGERASGRHAELAIVEIPDGIEYEIEEYDGNEWVAEQHRTWR